MTTPISETCLFFTLFTLMKRKKQLKFRIIKFGLAVTRERNSGKVVDAKFIYGQWTHRYIIQRTDNGRSPYNSCLRCSMVRTSFRGRIKNQDQAVKQIKSDSKTIWSSQFAMCKILIRIIRNITLIATFHRLGQMITWWKALSE